MRRALTIISIVLGALVAIVAGLFGALQTDFARSEIRDQLTQATAGTSMQVQVGGIEGLLPFEMRLTDLRVSDRNGVWLTIDRIALDWSPMALLGSRLQIDDLTAGKVALARTPIAEEVEESAAEPSGPLLPELPIDIDVRRASIGELALAAPVLGEASALSVDANARIGELADGLAASLALRQLSGQTGTAMIDLAYRPDDDFLNLSANIQEPQGGIVGRLLGLPQDSDLRIALDGKGPLDAWDGRMNAVLDGGSLVDLTAQVRGHETRTITFALRATPDALLTPQIAPLVAGGVTADGTIEIAAGGDSIDVSRLLVGAAPGSITASGSVGLSGQSDLQLALDLGNSTPFAGLVPDVSWAKADVDAHLTGTLEAPQVNASLAVQDLAAAGHRVGSTALTLDASAERGLDQPIGLRADLTVSNVTAPDLGVQALLADGANLKIAGSLDRAGTIIADAVELHAGQVQLAGSGRAEAWGASSRRATARLTVADLQRVAGAFGLPGKGGAEIALDLAPVANGERLELSGSGQDFSIGQPIADRLMGSSPTLHVALEGQVPANITISDARFDGAKARLSAAGTVKDRALDLTFDGKLDDMSAIEPSARGPVALNGAVSGTIDAPGVTAEVTSPSLAFAGHTAQNLQVKATASELTTAPRIKLDGSASLDRLPAQLALSATQAGEQADVQDLALSLGKSRVTGKATLVESLVTGRIDLSAPDLGEIGGLAGVPMSGELSAALDLAAANGRQNAKLTATGHRISAADALTTDEARLSGTMQDLLGTPNLDVELGLADAVVANQPLDQISVAAKGSMSALNVTASLTGPDLKAATEAEISLAAGGYRIGLQSLNATFKGIDVKNEAPATIEIAGDATRIAPLALAIEDGTLRLQGTAAPDNMDLALAIESVPVSLARAFAPDLPLTGRIDGEVHASGTPAKPSGTFALTGTGLGASDVAEQQADLDLSGTLQQGRLDLKGTVQPKTGGELDFTAALAALSADADLQAHAGGTLDLALVDAFLAGGADRVKGKAELDITATGRASAPVLAGQLRLADTVYENLRYGIKLQQIAAELRANGPTLEIVSFSGATPDNGRISGQGTVDLTSGTAMDLAFQARNAIVIDSDLATARIDGDLAITGSVESQLDLGGKINILRADIRVPDRLPASVQQIEVKEVNVPPQLAERAAASQPKPRQTLVMNLDLAVDAPQQVAVRGRGLDAELGGAIHIGGTADKPEIGGGFELRRGTLDIVGRRLDFTEGRMTFDSGDEIDPVLDLTAVTRATDLEVTAKVEGSARAPRIVLSSTPTMPEDEILARLLFDKSAGALSAFELVQLAQATAELAGVSSGPGVLDKIRKSTGLDRLAVEQGQGSSGPSLAAGRYVADGVYVGVSQGAGANNSAATVEIEVTPNVKVESEIGADAAGKAGVNLEWDY